MSTRLGQFSAGRLTASSMDPIRIYNKNLCGEAINLPINDKNGRDQKTTYFVFQAIEKPWVP
jgi:hypothetical protein